MKFKKIALLGLAAVLAAGLLAGCGGKKPPIPAERRLWS